MSVLKKVHEDWRKQRHVLLDKTVAYQAPTPVAIERHQRVRDAVAALGHVAIDACPVCPELDEALRVLVDVVMPGLNAAIARNHDQLPADPPVGDAPK